MQTKLKEIYKVEIEIYEKFVNRVLDEINDKSFFSDVITINSDSIDFSLIASIIIYRKKEGVKGDVNSQIIKLTPVWWEFKSITDDGEILNDFDFNIFNNLFHKCIKQ